MKPTTPFPATKSTGIEGFRRWRRFAPVVITTVILILSLVDSSSYPAGAATSGRIKAWGYNGDYQLGNNSTDEEHSPVSIPNLDNVKNISGGGRHALALKQNGTVKAWGDNVDGQLGNNDAPNDSPVPISISGLDKIKAVSAGSAHSLALKGNGTVRAWGSNNHGELGNDDAPNDSPVPVRVDGLDHVIAISAGQNVSYALKENGTVWSWGLNDSGQLGNGDSPNDRHVPVKVKGLDGVKAIAANSSAFHALAVKENGTVRAWGYNDDGELGNGSDDNSDVPVRVSNLDHVKNVSGGYVHSLALKKNGTVWAWGQNNDGVLGTGNEDDKLEPVKVKNLKGVVEIAAGASASFALKSSGTVRAWGSNSFGQLGDGTVDPRFLPVKVHNLADVKHIAGGATSTYAVKN